MTTLSSLVSELEDCKPDASPFADKMLADEAAAQLQASESDDGTEAPSATVYPAVSNSDNGGVSGGSVFVSEGNAEIFDPSIHAVDAAGNPKRNKDGSLAKKRGRKSGSSGPLQSTIRVDTTVAAQELQYKNAAAVTVQSLVILGYCIGGVDEWKPENDELIAMQLAWTEYYKAKGITDMPPWIGVAIATGGYAMPRFSKPKTKERLTAIFAGIKPALLRVGKWLRLSS